MSYIGTPPSNAFTSLLKQDFSTSATTGYTLDHAVNNANDIALFINFVRQEPTAGYAASGTTLTLTSATASSDDMYCVYLGQALQTVNPANSSVGATQLASNAVTTAKILDANVTAAKLASGVLPTNTPAFQAYQGSASTYGAAITLITCNTEVFDSNSAYDTSAYRFTPQVAGKYFFYGQIYIASPGTNLTMQCRLSKNGSAFAVGDQNSAVNRDQAVVAHGSVDLNGSSDYVDLRGYNSSSVTTVAGSLYTYFGGYKLIT